MTKNDCELCGRAARMFCESDQASLCWDCDDKVHAANFLVAKHSRTLLCHVCRSPTPWKAAGLNLGPTVSVCHACTVDGQNREASSSGRDENEDGYHSRGSESDEGGEYDTESDDYSEEVEEEEEEEEEGENQVVPAAASSSTSEENVSFSSTKRRTLDNPFESEDEDGCCSSQDLEPRDSYTSDLSLLRASKLRRVSNDGGAEQAGSSGTVAIVEKLRGFQREIVTTEGGKRRQWSSTAANSQEISSSKSAKLV